MTYDKRKSLFFDRVTAALSGGGVVRSSVSKRQESTFKRKITIFFSESELGFLSELSEKFESTPELLCYASMSVVLENLRSSSRTAGFHKNIASMFMNVLDKNVNHLELAQGDTPRISVKLSKADWLYLSLLAEERGSPSVSIAARRLVLFVFSFLSGDSPLNSLFSNLLVQSGKLKVPDPKRPKSLYISLSDEEYEMIEKMANDYKVSPRKLARRILLAVSSELSDYKP